MGPNEAKLNDLEHMLGQAITHCTKNGLPTLASIYEDMLRALRELRVRATALQEELLTMAEQEDSDDESVESLLVAFLESQKAR